MVGGYDRRAVLRGLGAGVLVGGAGCLRDPERPVGGADSDPTLAQNRASTGGRVTTSSDEPIAGATVTAIREGGTALAAAETDAEGRFSIPLQRPAWLRIEHGEYLTETQAVGPDMAVHRTLIDETDAISLQFVGDVMFGRRFYQANSDPLAPRFRIDPETRLDDHREILRSTRPLLETGDITSVNLATPLTTADVRHPEKPETYASHPVAARALSEVGVDHAALGNDHVFDALDSGLEETLESLTENDLAHSGAGFSSEEAWAPAYIEKNGVTVAYLSCTTITGDAYAVDWSVDREAGGDHTIDQGGERWTIPASSGVAEATPDRLRTAIETAGETADVVVVHIHGGDEFHPDPTGEIRTLSEGAIDSGADLVIDHHPHVVGGIEPYGDGTIVWSLGDFVSDLEHWGTLTAFLFTARVTVDGVVRTSVEPLLREGYLPTGVVGRPRDHVLRTVAGRSPAETTLLDGQLRTPGPPNEHEDPHLTEREQRSFTAVGSVYSRDYGWVEEIATPDGIARLGRDRLPTGSFEDTTIDRRRFEGPLWRYERGSDPIVAAGIGYDGTGGARLIRRADDERALLAPRHRLPIADAGSDHTLTMWYSYTGDAGLDAHVRWYDERRDDPVIAQSLGLGGTGGEWRRLVWHLAPPTDAASVECSLMLDPPDAGGVHEARFDDVRLIEWAAPGVTGGRQYDHLYLDGQATINLAASHHSAATAREIGWSPLADEGAIVAGTPLGGR